MKFIYSLLLAFFCLSSSLAQHPSAIMDLESSSQGLLIPRMSLAQRLLISDPATGLLVFQTDSLSGFYYNAGIPASPDWILLNAIPTTLADSDGDTKIQTEKNADEDIIRMDLAGTEKLVFQQNAAGIARFELTDASANLYIGEEAGKSTSSGFGNNAFGYHALRSNTIGIFNNAFGYQALTSNTDGEYNSAFGAQSLKANTTGNNNTGMGSNALRSNTTGSDNVAFGMGSLEMNLSGNENVASGYESLQQNRNGSGNVAMGAFSMRENLNGSQSVAFGMNSAKLDSMASNSVYLGYEAGAGTQLHHKTGNVFIGFQAGKGEMGSNKLIIENSDAADTSALIYGEFDNDLVRINSSLGVGRIPTSNALEVNGNASKSSAGDWLANSDRRLKKNIQQLDGEVVMRKILQIRGVSFEWDDNVTGIRRPEGPQAGLIAQEVQKVFPELVLSDSQGYLQTSYGTYDAYYIELIRWMDTEISALEDENARLKAMLSNEIQLLHKKFEETEKEACKSETKLDSKMNQTK